MSLCIECCFPGNDETSKQITQMLEVSTDVSNQINPSLRITSDTTKGLKLINGQIPAKYPKVNAAGWNPSNILQQARYDALLQRSHKIDPNYQFYSQQLNSDGASKYNVKFEDKYNHGLYKIAKNYYIITKSNNIHRLTIETFVNDGSAQRIYLNSIVILNSRGPGKDLVWDSKICSPNPRMQAKFAHMQCGWSAINIWIERRVYVLLAQHPEYQRKNLDIDYYLIDKAIKSWTCNFLVKCMIVTYCTCNCKCNCCKIANSNIPHFQLITLPWDHEFGKCEYLEDMVLQKWKFEIDSKSIIHQEKVWLHCFMVLFDILMFLPSLWFFIYIIYFYVARCIFCDGCYRCCGQWDYDQIECEHEPETIVFDEKEAIKHFKEVYHFKKANPDSKVTCNICWWIGWVTLLLVTVAVQLIITLFVIATTLDLLSDIHSLPLYDTGPNARGIVAIGEYAEGVIAIGYISVGVIAIGNLSVGVIAIGQVSAGGIFALGMLGGSLMWAIGMMVFATKVIYAMMGFASWKVTGCALLRFNICSSVCKKNDTKLVTGVCITNGNS